MPADSVRVIPSAAQQQQQQQQRINAKITYECVIRCSQYNIELRQVSIDNDKINKEILSSDSPMNDFISEF